jgi:hypothetical protein
LTPPTAKARAARLSLDSASSANDDDNDDDDDDDLNQLNVYQPLPGLTKPSVLASSLSKPRHARSPSGDNSVTVYAYVPGTKPTSPLLTKPAAPDKLRRKSNERPAENNDPTYQVPAMLKPQSMSHVERRSRAEPQSASQLTDYAGLSEERFSKYMDDSARAIINERKHDVPTIPPSPTAQLGSQLTPPTLLSTPPPLLATSSSASSVAPTVPTRGPLSPTPGRLRQRVVQDGTVTLDDNGQALVQLPLQFVRECRDFRYFLTPIGRFAALFVSQEVDVASCSFRIAGGSVGSKVCWQIVGDKQQYNNNRIE